MEKLDLEKCGQEANEMQGLPPASVEVSRLGVFAIITLIQAAVQQPEIADDEWTKIGIAAARQLQKDLFNQDSETYKVLEFGWNPGAYLVTPSDIAAILQYIESRREKKNKFIELDAGSDETIAQQISRKILESQGYLDM